MSISSDEATNKRQRVSRACDLCRKKKIKCDGASPVCGNCQAFHLDCSYKDTTKKRGPPKGYIEAIENRLHKLEAYLNDLVKDDQVDPRALELIKELQSPLETPAGEKINGRPQRRQRRSTQSSKTDTDTVMASPLSPLFDSPTLTYSEFPGEQDTSASGSPAIDSAGQLSMDENGGVRYLGKSSGFYLLSDSRTYQNGAFHFSGYAHQFKVDQNLYQSSRKRRYSNVDPLDLPPKDLSEHLITLYFTHFYPVLPMFYKRRLVCSSSPLEPVSPLLLNAIYAIASRVSSDERVRSDPHAPDTAGDIFYERAKCLLDDYYDTPKISTVQALLLMASHQQGAMKSARAWLYSGMAFRMAQDLGLNRNCDHWNISPEERDRRKRVFWCCYIVDRVTSAIYGRAPNFEEKDCDVPFPAVDDDEPIAAANQDQSRPPIRLLEVFTQNIKICDILGHVLKNIYFVKAKHHTDSHYIDRILTTLHRQLLQWHSSLPIALQYKLPNTQIGEKGPDPPSAICQLHLTYYTTMILLHRSFIPGPTQSQLPISLPSYKICESAATSVLDIVNIMLGENHLRFVHNFSVFFVFTAGIIFIKVASSADPDRAFDAKININRIMRALDDLELTWMNAARCCNILGELAGLRDIKLESDKYVPKLDNKTSPPPCIAVPNSPELNRDYQQQAVVAMQPISIDYNNGWNSSNSSPNSTPATQKDFGTSLSLYLPTTSTSVQVSSVRPSIQHGRSASLDSSNSQHKNLPNSNQRSFSTSVLGIAPTMDPFAAPGIVPGPLQQQEFDPLGTAFWGMPTSLNTEEWNAYFDNLQQQQPQPSPQEQQLTDLLNSTSKSFEQTSNYIYDQQPRHSKPMSSLDLPMSPSQSVLFGFLPEPNQRNSQEQTFVSSPKAIDYSNSGDNSIANTSTDVLYW
ncbi:fungal-specific transcription factor domain-containing protein [Parasitella parasitica]|nr:fungal-specific transcription factor domain-containing protein [Parasitella parasitica]